MNKRIEWILNEIRIRAYYSITYLFPIKKNRIVLSSFYGKGYGDNPKYIAEQLYEMDNSLDLIWVVESSEKIASLPNYIKPCVRGSMQYYYYMNTAKVWVDNCRSHFLNKKRKQKYLQTWHGFALKRIEKDVEDSLSQQYVRTAVHDSDMIDAIVSDSRHMTNIYKKSFWYNGRVYEWGAPRNDILITSHKNGIIRKKVCEIYGLSNECKFVIYAPTFRSNRSLDYYKMDFSRVINACERKFGGEFVVLVRLHPNIADKSYELGLNGSTAIDASGYPDIQELLAVSDVAISDYSSIMFDFATTNKPCFQFSTDIEDYLKDRNFYFQLDKLPFPLAKSNDELEQIILNFNQYNYAEEISKFFSEVKMVRDGDASKKSAELILSVVQE